MKLCTTKIELNRVHTCVVLCTCKIFKLLYVDMKGFINGSFSFQINENIFSQRSFVWLLKEYIYALTDWSMSGGDDRLSAADALDKAKSTIEEMITIADRRAGEYYSQMLRFTFRCLLTYLWAIISEHIINIILKINDMRLLAQAYMTKGNIYLGEETAVKVSFPVFATEYLELCSFRSAAL